MKTTTNGLFAVVSSVVFWAACATDGSESDNAAANEVVQSSADALTQRLDLSTIANSAHPFFANPFDGVVVWDDQADRQGSPKRKACGLKDVGTCPSKTFICDGDKVRSVKLEWKGDASGNVCKQSGLPIEGALIATAAGEQTFSATFIVLKKGTWVTDEQNGTGSLFNGDVTFKRAKGIGNWEISMTALAVDVKQNGDKPYPECQSSCISRIAYSLLMGVTVSTQAPLMVNVERNGKSDKDLIVTGSIFMTGRVSGHFSVWRRREDVTPNDGQPGREYLARDEDFARDFNGREVALSAVKYDLPINCACPTAGTLSTESGDVCGRLTVLFAPETRDGKCAVAEAGYYVDGVPNRSLACEELAETAELAINDSCVPVENPRPRY
ncbi:MAG: hypothetical protein HYY84_17985 [Deltaproteobacteria bacterium]|nr:hypothetical protein [Deltaproteobacteria bacterium]